MRAEFTIGFGSIFPPTLGVNIDFLATTIQIINNTSNPFYIRRGNNDIPTASNNDYPIAPGAVISLACSGRSFGFSLATSPAPTDANAVVKVILSGGLRADNRHEIKINKLSNKAQVPLNFAPKYMIAMNNTPQKIMVNQGSRWLPRLGDADLTIPGNYFMIVPVSGVDYGIQADPITDPLLDCTMIWTDGEGLLDLVNDIIYGFTLLPFPPLPPPFDWCHLFDFTVSDWGFCAGIIDPTTGCPVGSLGNYVPGVGWLSDNVSGANDIIFIEKYTNPATTVFKIQEITAYYLDSATGLTNRTPFTRKKPPAGNLHESHFTQSSVHGDTFVTAAFNNTDVNTVGVQIQKNGVDINEFLIYAMLVCGSVTDPY